MGPQKARRISMRESIEILAVFEFPASFFPFGVNRALPCG
jgi:hypothetical protein